MTDIEIIEGLRKGDQRSYETLYNKLYRRIRFFAGQYVHDLDIAHELTIEAFITLWRKRCDFDTVNNIKAFLFITVKNACLNHLKHQKRKKQAHDDILYATDKDSDYILDDAVTADMLSHIFRELETLPGKSKHIFHLHCAEGLTYKEISHQLHISVENVRVKHSNALQALRIGLKKKGLLLLALICTFLFI